MIKEHEELVIETDEILPEEFEKEKKFTMWLSVLVVGFGIVTLIAATAPKGNASAKAIKYDLNCLTDAEHITNPLNECQ